MERREACRKQASSQLDLRWPIAQRIDTIRAGSRALRLSSAQGAQTAGGGGVQLSTQWPVTSAQGDAQSCQLETGGVHTADPSAP